MTLSLSTVGGFAVHKYSAPLMAAPVVHTALYRSRKPNRSFFVRPCRFSRCAALKMEADEQDYSGTPYVPVYVMLPRWIMDKDYGLVTSVSMERQWLKMLKSMNVDGVKVECWWGLVEPQAPKQYHWSAYNELFETVRSYGLKLQVVLCFHAWAGDGVHIPLPRWVMELGREDPDIFFTDRDGRRNYECLSWGIDQEPLLLNRSPLQVYRDFMISFSEEFKELVVDGFISEIEIGVGPCGELRFPSHIGRRGWEYPPIEEFQCYDKYTMKSLNKAWKERGDSLCSSGRRPNIKDSYNSSLRQVESLRQHGHVSFYARFFVNWYIKVLVDHADMLLSLANSSLPHCNIAAKIPGICHLWYETNIDVPLISILHKCKTSLSCSCSELRTIHRNEDFPQELANEIGGLGWQVLDAAWSAGVAVRGENDVPCYDKRGYQEILDVAKPSNGTHLSTFTYLMLTPQLMEEHNLKEFQIFVQRMHGHAHAQSST